MFGRVLDRIFEVGCSSLFSSFAIITPLFDIFSGLNYFMNFIFQFRDIFHDNTPDEVRSTGDIGENIMSPFEVFEYKYSLYIHSKLGF